MNSCTCSPRGAARCRDRSAGRSGVVHTVTVRTLGQARTGPADRSRARHARRLDVAPPAADKSRRDATMHPGRAVCGDDRPRHRPCRCRRRRRRSAPRRKATRAVCILRTYAPVQLVRTRCRRTTRVEPCHSLTRIRSGSERRPLERADSVIVLGRRGVAPDVDTPPGQARGEPRVLTFLADRERQLVVGHHHTRGAGSRVDDRDRDNLRR